MDEDSWPALAPMLITCPACSAAYTIDDHRVGKAGRKVRCSQCRGTWFVSRPAQDAGALVTGDAMDMPASDAIVPVIGQAGTVRRPPPRKAGGRKGRGSRWAHHAPGVLASLLAVALPSALLLRSSIVGAAPQSARVFAAIGLPVNLVGLDLADVSSGFTEEDAKRVLIVEGAIVNPTARPLPVPPIQVTVEGTAGNMLYAWSTQPPRPDLAPAETTRFRIRLASPPPEGRRVTVTFNPRARADAVASR